MKKILSSIVIILMIISISHAKDISSLLESARNGDVESMCDLGVVYFNGEGTLKDPFKAKCWIKKAYAKGSDRAEKIWEDLELWKYSGRCEASFDDEDRPRYSKGMVYKEFITGIEFVFIPRACFMMGCHKLAEKCRKNEKPGHKVCLDGFWIGKYEVTQKQWQHIMGENPSRFNTNSNHPVENVSFDDIQKFLLVLNSKTREKFVLPTEAQWESACRNGGKNINFSWGNESYRPQQNCGTCDTGSFSGGTSPVGHFLPNESGLYDMAGNVKEWCQDTYDKKAYLNHAKKNPVYEEKESSRVVRGGSFTDNTSDLRCIARDKSIPSMKSDNIGFRLVLKRDN
ncbi:MAG: SUMF1/EgtB/PvdO family nonheme iron enzyme [Desulfobacteraceae bacterium]|nr:SUMF1/EgtB/PvdO family nonheme iron enzyme [Desulfobacteraceae bacterium]